VAAAVGGAGVTPSVVFDSPVGALRVVVDGAAVVAIRFTDESVAHSGEGSTDPLLSETRRQLDAYFAGRLRDFDLPLAPSGTDFQLRVWQRLRLVPFGATCSYGDLASRLGLPLGASRAVGLANGANPIAIVIPCHRVIGADGGLVGYAGGLHRKRILLELESPSVQDCLFEG